MEKRNYIPAEIRELGPIKDITQGNLNGNQTDGQLITVNVVGVGPVTVFGTLSGIPNP